MITYHKGNILHDQAGAIIYTVNTVGVMGKGLALKFKKAFPDNFKVCKKACDDKSLVTGTVLPVYLDSINSPFYIINFPTKAHWKGQSKLEYIESGLESLKAEVCRLDLKSVAIPALGSGLGSLPWYEVEQVGLHSQSCLMLIGAFIHHKQRQVLSLCPIKLDAHE